MSKVICPEPGSQMTIQSSSVPDVPRTDGQLLKLRREKGELMNALRPFSHEEFCKVFAGNYDGDLSPVYGRNNVTLYLGDFRRARKLLARLDAEAL